MFGRSPSCLQLFDVLNVARLQVQTPFDSRKIEMINDGAVTAQSFAGSLVVRRQEEFPKMARHRQRKMRIVAFPVARPWKVIADVKTHVRCLPSEELAPRARTRIAHATRLPASSVLRPR